MSMTKTADARGPRPDVLVLGAGVIGLVSALRLLRSGRSVTVLERKAPGAGASHGNCGTITPSHVPLHRPGTVAKALRWMFTPDAPFRVAPRLDWELAAWMLRFSRLCNTRDYHRVARQKAHYMLASRDRLAELIREEGLNCEFTESGTMYVYRSEQAFAAAEDDARLLVDIAVPVQVLSGVAARRMEPALNGSIVGAHYHPGDARLRPDRYVAELARAIREAGGQILEGEEIQGFERDGDRLIGVRTGQGEHSVGQLAGQVVFALGAWSPLIGRQLGLKLPIQPGKGYSITYSRPERAPAIPLVLKERGVCVTRWDSGYRLGSTMEFAGYDDSLNPVRLAALERGAAEYLDQPTGPRLEERWSGWRPMVPDDMPIIGRAPGWKNLWLATGHGMLGVSLSAITGELIAELITGRAPSMDLEAVSPGRFG